MVDDLTSDSWSTFQFNMGIGVTLPTDYIGSTSVSARILSSTNDMILFTASSLSAVLPVAKPTGTTATSSTLISFGVDPSDSAKQGLGAALYSNTFCSDRVEVL
jgi:hypothetical protein